jgi:hypothetical protein
MAADILAKDVPLAAVEYRGTICGQSAIFGLVQL